MKIVLSILIIFFLNINGSNAISLPGEKSNISNGNLLDLREIYKSKTSNITSINVNVQFLEKNIVKTYKEKPIYKILKNRLKLLGYTGIFFDYANTKTKGKLEYKFHNYQQYKIENKSNKQEKFIIKFYPVTPELQKYPSEYFCIKKTNSVILNPDYGVVNLNLKSKNKGKIKLKKRGMIQKNLNGGDGRQGICNEAKYFNYSIYFYYEAEIIINKNKTDTLIFSYDSLNYYNSNITTPGNYFLSAGVSDWSPQEATGIPISFKINIANNYNLYKINKDSTKIEVQNKTFKYMRYNLFQILKK